MSEANARNHSSERTFPPSGNRSDSVDLAEELHRLWKQGQQPDVKEFLRRAGSIPVLKAAEVLCADQHERWALGQRIPAESYLKDHPQVVADPEAALDVVFNEYLLRERQGERPELGEYMRRFPEHAGALKAQAELHRAIAADSGPTASASPRSDAAALTAPYPEGGQSPGVPARRIKVALVPGAGPQPTTDLQALLHRRLRFLATFLSGGFALAILLIATTNLPLDAWAYFAVSVLALGPVFASVLWLRRSLSVRQLRAIELALFGTLYVQWSLVHAFLYPTTAVLDTPPPWFGFILAYAVSLPWVFLIILYGILIPNTWRRCAAVVGVMAVTPLVISTATGLAAKVTAGYSPVNFLGPVGMFMAGAAAIAIYSSHRIEVLRQEVLVARRLGQYQLKQRLGSGGMGEVYLAEHVLLRRPCAVKLIRPDRTTDSNSLVRFEREVQATAALTHPNTVQIFDYGHAEDGTFYYAMEYLPGLSLDDLVKRHGPLPPERAVHLLRQVCGALHEAHAARLIHRDIKPSNIITCVRGGLHDVAKLLDFGLVRSHDSGGGADHLTQEGAIAGTPAYMSPEQADGKKDLDARSDIYSLGAVAYFLLTGQPPFVRPTPLQTLIAHLCDAPAPLNQLRPDVPADLQAVVLRCLEKDPARRFPHVRNLDAALAACHAAGRWTEERAAGWWHGQTAAADGASSLPEARTMA